MESIKKLRAAREKLKNPGTLAHPVSDEAHEAEEHEQSLGEIFADKAEHTRFTSFLGTVDSQKAGEVINALADGHVLAEADEKWLEKQRKAFNTRSFEVEKVREILDEEGVENLVHLNPKIALVVGKIGVEKAAKFLSDEFEELAFSDPKAFKKMTTALRGLRDVRSRPSSLALERRFRDQLFSYGIAESDYFEKAAGDSTLQTKEELGKLAKSQYGVFKKAINFVTAGALEHRAGKKLYQTREEQQKLSEELEKHEKSIGAVLAGTLNGDMKLAIQKAMLEGGEVEDKKETFTVETIDEYREAKAHAFVPADIKKRFEGYRDAELQRRNIKDPSKQPQVLSSIEDSFVNQEYAKVSKFKGRGIFAVLLGLLNLGALTKQAIKNAIK